MGLENSDPKIPPRPIPETTKSDEGKQVIGKDDLVPRERKRLGDYLAYQTQIVFKNEYPISPGSTLFKQRTTTGNPAPIVDNDTNAVKTYMDDVSSNDKGQKARSIFESISDSGQLDTDTKFKIKKGKSDEQIKSGNDYFREIDEKGGKAEIPSRIESIQKQNNRFSEGSPAFIPGQKEGQGNSIGSLIVQPKLGQHLPQKFPNKVDADGKDFVSIPIDKLKNFGVVTLLQASGELNIPKDLSDPSISIVSSIIANPGIARIGQKIPVSRFDGVKILNEVEPTFNKQLRDSQLQGVPIFSHGNVNNPLAPFAGLTSAASVSTAQILALSVAGMLKSLYIVLNALEQQQIKQTGVGFSTDVGNSGGSLLQQRRLRLGSHNSKQNDTAFYHPYRNYTVINLVETKFPYFDCVNKGISVFFDTESSSRNLMISQSKSIELSAGWYNTIFRSLMKNTGDLLLQLIPGAKLFQKQSYDVEPNLGEGVSESISDSISAANYIRAINNSVILKFMNIMALIGDAAFTEEKNQISLVDTINDIGEGPFGETTPKLGILHIKNRLSDQFGNKLAWSGNTVKSMYLLPTQIKLAGERFDGDTSRFSSLAKKSGFRTTETGRLSASEVEAMENYLEADYLPFYFHDLRTNEIISFHAFLESISDKISVSYNESEGYGRIGKVLTYKNTTRTINLEFLVAATSLDDFDDMWVKINKLTTLLYPQYTQGRNLQFGENSFIQPFSQLPAASPLIRLRLGDIFKSNYNRFDLARIFGISSQNFNLETNADREFRRQNSEREERIAAARDALRRRAATKDWRVGDILILDENTHDYMPYLAADVGGGNNEISQGLILAAPAEITVVYVEDDTLIYFTLNSPNSVSNLNPEANINGKFKANRVWARMSNEEIERQAQLEGGEEPTLNEEADRAETMKAIRNFFNPDGENPNPIFKSFESVKGRGLAGFISSFDMTIDKNFTWETFGINNRAPKMLKISLQFEPIHDLQPGLDHNGFNSAPIYNVGETMKQLTKNSNAELSYRQSQYILNTQLTNGRRRSFT